MSISKEHDELTTFLLRAVSSSDAMLSLFRFRKACLSKFSLGLVSRKAGIPSTGYLSDVFHGRKLLNQKYHSKIGPALGLNPTQSQFLALLLAFEQETDTNKHADLQKEISKTRKILTLRHTPLPPELYQETLFHLLMLSSFSLFQNAPTLENLVSYFGESSRLQLEAATEHLQKIGLISKTGAYMTLTNARLIFGDGENSMSQVQFLKEALIHATQNIDTIFAAKNSTIVSTNLITVNRGELSERLKVVRQEFLKIQVELDSNEGDDLLYFNVQVYPHSLVSQK